MRRRGGYFFNLGWQGCTGSLNGSYLFTVNPDHSFTINTADSTEWLHASQVIGQTLNLGVCFAGVANGGTQESANTIAIDGSLSVTGVSVNGSGEGVIVSENFAVKIGPGAPVPVTTNLK